MSEPRDHEQWPDDLKLDDEAGPASYLSPAAREALVQNVLGQAYPPRRQRGWMVAALALACLGGGSASAAVYWYARHAEPAVVPATKAAPAKVVPRVEPKRELIEQPLLEVREEPTPEPPAPRPTRAADDWLREGNRLRAARRWKQADEAYGRALQQAVNDDAAYVAFVASAGVRLEHLGDARGALARYRGALKASPHGALDEEVRFGIADAYRALGDAAREREALEAFLRDHPQSPLAEQARARLH